MRSTSTTSAGYFLTQIATENPNDGPCGLAVDNNPASPSYGDLYVNNWRENVVKYTPSEFPPQPARNLFPPQPATSYSGTVLDSTRSTGLATDSHGNVFVDERTDVAEFDPTGTLVKRFGEGTLGASPGAGYGIAVSSFPATEGDVYVADAAEHIVKAYGPAGEPLVSIEGAGTPQGGFHSLLDSSLAVDPTDGHVFVADDLEEPFEHPAAVVDEFNSAGVYRGQISKGVDEKTGHSLTIVDAEPSGLAVDGSGNVYVTSGNTEEAALYIFGPTSPAHSLEVSKSGSGEGTVTSKPAGINCGKACKAEYSAGEKVTLTVTPAAGSAFAGFTGACTGTETCTVTMSATQSVAAEFEAVPGPLLLPAGGPKPEGGAGGTPAALSAAVPAQGTAASTHATSAASSRPSRHRRPKHRRHSKRRPRHR